MITLMMAAIENDNERELIISLYKNYYNFVRKIIFSITHDDKDIEDLIDDTFIKIIDKISIINTLDCRKTVAYVAYTTKSVSINYLKHKKVENKHLFWGEEDDIAENISILEDNMEDRLVHQEDINLLSDSIMLLPQKQRDLLYFKYILELSNKEIADNFGVTESSVRQYLTRSRRKAKKLFERMSNHD